MLSYLIIAVVAVVILCGFAKGFWPGLCCCTAFLVSLPKHVQIPLPGNLPALTVHRLIVLLLLVYWLRERQARIRGVELPFKKFLLLVLLTQGLATVFATDLVSSIKAFLYYGLENVLYFAIVVSVMRDQNDAVRLVRAVCAGLLGVAILAFIERYNGYSPMQYFPGYYEDEGSVMVTFSHRILLGAAMAMAWPLSLFWVTAATKQSQRWLAWVTSFLCLGACFFAHSRGPWLATVLVGITLATLGSASQRKRLALVGALALVLLAANSGVRDTIFARLGSTMVDDSPQAQSYQWRWELWHKAWKEICRSPAALALGYGPGASEALSWEDVVSSGEFVDSFASWDNHWAAYMLECGLVGFAVLLLFYAALVARMLKTILRARGRERDLAAFIFAALVVFLFMQTQVKIFAAQLDYIFWSVLAAGIALERQMTWSRPVEQAPDTQTEAAFGQAVLAE